MNVEVPSSFQNDNSKSNEFSWMSLSQFLYLLFIVHVYRNLTLHGNSVRYIWNALL